MMGAPGQLMQSPMQGAMQPMMMSAGPRPPGVPFDPKFGKNQTAMKFLK
jgi:hypothetical protein